MRNSFVLVVLLMVISFGLLSQTKGATKASPQKEKSVVKALKGKLLIEFYGNTAPLINASVSLMKNGKIDSSTITRTDKYGDFEVMLKNNTDNYGLSVEPETKEVTTIILATQQGQEISRMKRGPKGFTYDLIPADISMLTEMQTNEDIFLTVDKFVKGSKTELKVIENINYASDEFKVNKAAQITLDKIVKLMKESPALKLEIISHTDAKGDDKFNSTLSQKRSMAVLDYLVVNGIEQNRLHAKGSGETMIRNRCKNGIDCTEKEHAYNRRTEFNFSK